MSFWSSRVWLPLERLSWLSADRPSDTREPVPEAELDVRREGRRRDVGERRLPARIGLDGRPLPVAEGGADGNEREGPAAERAAPADVADRPLALIGLRLHEPLADALQPRGPGERVRQGEGHAIGQVGAARHRGRAGVGHAARVRPLLAKEALESAEGKLILQAGVERGEIVGGAAGEPGARVDRTHVRHRLAQAGAVADQEAQSSREVDRGPELVGARVVQRLRQNEGAAVTIRPDRIPARERAAEHEAAARDQPRTEPRGQLGRELERRAHASGRARRRPECRAGSDARCTPAGRAATSRDRSAGHAC